MWYEPEGVAGEGPRRPRRVCEPSRATPQAVTAPSDTPRVLADIALEIDPDEVLRFQGYKRGADVPSREVRALFDEAMGLGRRLMEPRAVVHWAPVTRRDGDTLQAGGGAFTIPAIERGWGPAAGVAAAVGTSGDLLERRGGAAGEAGALRAAGMAATAASGA